MKNQKNYTIIAIIVVFIIIISIVIASASSLSKKTQAKEFVAKVSQFIVKQMTNETIYGQCDFQLNVKSDVVDNINLIDNANYKAIYKINNKTGTHKFELTGTYGKDILKSNVSIVDNQVLISLDEEIYNKSIVYSNSEFLKYISKTSNTKEVIKLFFEELDNTIKKSQYDLTKTKINDEKVNKITLDLTDDNPKLRKKIFENLQKNKEFIKELSELEGFSEKIIRERLKQVENYNFKISLYTSKKNNEIVKIYLLFNGEEIVITPKNNQYYYKYYHNDGLEYEGYVNIQNNEIKKIKLKNHLKHYTIEIKINKNSIKFNENLNDESTIPNNIIHHTEITESVKQEIRNKSNILKEIYNNYLEQFVVEPDEG